MRGARKTRILFVCGGNTCRSPMAAAIAGVLFGDVVHAESAGADAYGGFSTKEAAQIVQEEFGIDISGHRPRDVEEVSLSDFDYVVAMKPYIAHDLGQRFSLPQTKVVTWDIDDPFGRGADEYRRCAKEISERLRELAAHLNLEVR